MSLPAHSRSTDPASSHRVVRRRYKLRYQPPYAWTPLIRFLAARAIPGVETVSDEVYRRVFDIGGACGHLAVLHRPERHQLELDVWVSGGANVPAEMIPRIAQVFDVAADPTTIAAHFAEDGVIGPRARHLPGLRVPGAWDLFELGVRAILGQQVTVKGASTLSGRLVLLCGRATPVAVPGLSHVFPRPQDLAAADLSRLGVPNRRRESLRVFAEACASGAVSLERADLDEVLLALPGFGDWTVQYMLMRACSDPDAFPASDLWLRRTAGEASVKALLQRAEAWRPFRAYAALYLWQGPAA